MYHRDRLLESSSSRLFVEVLSSDELTSESRCVIHDSGAISLKGIGLSSSDPRAALWNEQAFRANQAPLGSWSEAVTLTRKTQTDCCDSEVSQSHWRKFAQISGHRATRPRCGTYVGSLNCPAKTDAIADGSRPVGWAVVRSGL